MDLTRLTVLSIYVTCLALMTSYGETRYVKYEEAVTKSCTYGNKTYPGGSRFRPDPCTICHCPKRGGRPDCVIEDCKYDPDCVKYVKSPESLCCDVCVEHGCRDNDGRVYRPGQIVSTISCTTCRCPDGGGRIECGRVSCPDINCVDPVYEPGGCCLTCPNGANCWLGKEILPAGEMVRRNRCKTCRCPFESLPWRLRGKGPRAICNVTDC